MFNSRNVGRCIQHFLYCSFVLSLATLFGAHIIGCTFKNLAKNYVLHNFCWFSDIFSQTKYYHCDLSFPPFSMLLFWRTSEIFTQMLKFSSNLCINLPYFEHISTIWFFFISYITFVYCMICSAARAFIGTKSVSHSQREFHHYRRHY